MEEAEKENMAKGDVLARVLERLKIGSEGV